MSFEQFSLSEPRIKAIQDADTSGTPEPTPVQAALIPLVITGKDVLVAAPAGSGKAAAYAIPTLDLLQQDDPVLTQEPGRGPRILVLVPTREVALQVLDAYRTYGRHDAYYSFAVYGGVSMHPQVQALERGLDVLIATPARLLDHLGQGHVNLDRVRVVIFDEVDRMMDMGQAAELERLYPLLPAARQTIVVASSLGDDIRGFADGLLKYPEEVVIDRGDDVTTRVHQRFIAVDPHRKRDLMTQLFRDEAWPRSLVFARTKFGAEGLARKLAKGGVTANALHAHRGQMPRGRALEEFQTGLLSALVTTDMALRGFEMDGMQRVVHYDLPAVPDDYPSRLNRVLNGEDGRVGDTVAFVTHDDAVLLKSIERLLGSEIHPEIIPGYEPMSPEALAEYQAEQAAKYAADPRNARNQPASTGEEAVEGSDAESNGEFDESEEDRQPVELDEDAKARAEGEAWLYARQQTNQRPPRGRKPRDPDAQPYFPDDRDPWADLPEDKLYVMDAMYNGNKLAPGETDPLTALQFIDDDEAWEDDDRQPRGANAHVRDIVAEFRREAREDRNLHRELAGMPALNSLRKNHRGKKPFGKSSQFGKGQGKPLGSKPPRSGGYQGAKRPVGADGKPLAPRPHGAGAKPFRRKSTGPGRPRPPKPEAS
ncbi:MAG: DEAD/DEAH box helicase [Fluviibacter sp.]